MRALLEQYYKQILLEEQYSLVNEKIAPHGDARNELEMMRAGTKPAAAVTAEPYWRLYAPLMNLYGWEKIEFTTGNTQHYIIGQPGERARIERIAQLIRDMNAKKIPLDRNYHRELGRLLGYSEEDIEHFISRVETMLNKTI